MVCYKSFTLLTLPDGFSDASKTRKASIFDGEFTKR